MTAKEVEIILSYLEPEFEYNGELYSICCPEGIFYVTASDSTEDIELEFKTVDELLDGWIIQGKPLREILDKIEMG